MLISLRKGILLSLCCLAATPAVAAAQDDEVFVDPGSPSGKEYALPIDRARKDAAKRTKQRTDTQQAPLFGEGVNDDASGHSSPAAQPDGKGAAEDRPRSERRGGRAGRDAAAREPEAAAQAGAAAARAAARDRAVARNRALRAQAATPGDGIGLGGIIGAGIGVLLVGGLIGLMLRRRAAAG